MSDPCYADQISELTTGNCELEQMPEHNGVRISSGSGDGCYPVYAQTVRVGEWGERNVAVHIDFLMQFIGNKADK